MGSPFVGLNVDFGLSIIDVGGVVTNKIRLDVTSCHNTNIIVDKYVGANEIRILATPASEPESPWVQPSWTNNYNSDGAVTASGYYSNEQPWRAYSGTMLGGPSGDKDLWSQNATSGYLQLTLNYYIEVNSITFFNGVSTASNRTKNAYFTGSGGNALGDPFTALNENFSRVKVSLDTPVITNIIRLNVTSSYGSYIGASQIVIEAKELDTQPTMQTWTQPTWTSNSSENGTITASGYVSGENPYEAFDGIIGTSASQWTVQSSSGWLEINLSEYINVSQIYFYNRYSGSNYRTKNAYFTGLGGGALGSSFVALNENYGLSVINVGGVTTNVIRLNITSCYNTSLFGSKYVGANEIVIIGTKAGAPQ